MLMVNMYKKIEIKQYKVTKMTWILDCQLHFYEQNVKIYLETGM